MTRPKKSYELTNMLARARYEVMRKLGIPSKEAAIACTGGPRFSECLTRHGFNPSDYHELAKVRLGGDRTGKGLIKARKVLSANRQKA